MTDDEMRLEHYVAVVWRHRWMICALVTVTLIATVVITLLFPKIYRSTATLVAPRERASSLFGGELAIASGLLQQLPVLPSFTANRDLLISVLGSRTVAETVIDRFGLQERYRKRYREDAIKALRTATTISVSKEGAISLSVEDTDPKVAADIANYYMEQLDKLVTRFGTGEASQRAVFLAEQLARAKAALESAEGALRSFQEKNQAIVLQEQTKGAIEAAARLRGEIMAAEVQLQVLRNFATEANVDVIALRRRIAEMNNQLAQYGDRASGRDFSVPFSRVPQLGVDLARLTRDVKMHEVLVTLLAQNLEQAKINAAKDTPIVEVLDRAVPAERHSKPRLDLNLFLAGLTSLPLGIGLALFVEYVRHVPKPLRKI